MKHEFPWIGKVTQRTRHPKLLDIYDSKNTENGLKHNVICPVYDIVIDMVCELGSNHNIPINKNNFVKL